jgi:hypothetical protein
VEQLECYDNVGQMRCDPVTTRFEEKVVQSILQMTVSTLWSTYINLAKEILSRAWHLMQRDLSPNTHHTGGFGPNLAKHYQGSTQSLPQSSFELAVKVMSPEISAHDPANTEPVNA